MTYSTADTVSRDLLIRMGVSKLPQKILLQATGPISTWTE